MDAFHVVSFRLMRQYSKIRLKKSDENRSKWVKNVSKMGKKSGVFFTTHVDMEKHAHDHPYFIDTRSSLPQCFILPLFSSSIFS